MTRLLALLLLVLLPLQFSWAVMVSYCAHETQAAGHFGHHEHDAEAESLADPVTDSDAHGNDAPGAMDVDCGQCHGQCSVMPTLAVELPAGLVTAPPSASMHQAGGAHAPTRPERPQWLPLA